MKIGVLITGDPPPELDGAGGYDQFFARLLGEDRFEYQAWRVLENEFPASTQDADGWLITGSKHGAYEDHSWIAPLEAFVRDVYSEGRPMIGVCFGHQIIAQALGGTVEKFDGGWSIGHTDYEIDGEPMSLNAWHQDQVTVRPDSAKNVGSSNFCENAALLYGDHIWTIQPHPEFNADYIKGLIDIRSKGVVPPEIVAGARSKLDQLDDGAKIGAFMAQFFERERTK